MAFLESLRGGTAGAPPPVHFEPRVDATAEQIAAGKEAAAMPGYRPAERHFGLAIAAGATALLLEADGPRIAVRHRIDDIWRVAEFGEPGQAGAVMAALGRIAGPLVAKPDGSLHGGFIVRTAGARRPCRLSVQRLPAGSRMLAVIDGELEGRKPGMLAGMFRQMVPGRRDAAAGGVVAAMPSVAFGEAAAARVAGLDGRERAAAVLAAAIHARAGSVGVDLTATRAGVHHKIDGVWRPALTLDGGGGKAVATALKAAAGIDQRAAVPAGSGRCEIVVDGKPSTCTVRARAGDSGERITVELSHGRPRLTTLVDLGMTAHIAARVQELLAAEEGLIVVATPRHGGLTSLFDVLLHTIDRLVRDVVDLAPSAADRTTIQNVRQFRWDAAAGTSPAAVLGKAVREDARVLASCNLEDPELARGLATHASHGRLVIVGLRAADAAAGIVNLARLGGGRAGLGERLLAAIGGRLVRKLCPKCREESLPATGQPAALDSQAGPTLYRARPGGCAVCGGTGFLGRTGIFEVAAGSALGRHAAAAADTARLRQAMIDDGMEPLAHAARRLVAEGVTSVDEIRRVFHEG